MHMAITTPAAILLFIFQSIDTSSSFALSSNKNYYNSNRSRRIPRIISLRSSNDKVVDINDEPCIVGDNVVASCATPVDSTTSSDIALRGGTQTQLSAATNLGKCICGAGSFALPHVFLNEGVIGGTLAMISCGYLAMTTMQSINTSRYKAVELATEEEDDDTSDAIRLKQTPQPPTSYVQLTEMALGTSASKVVFALTLAASLGVCSTYIVFVGQTLASLSADADSNNIVHNLAPNVDENTWELITAGTVLPLSLIRNYGVFKFTSALGVTAVLGKSDCNLIPIAF